jgi:hypothetical protein
VIQGRRPRPQKRPEAPFSAPTKGIAPPGGELGAEPSSQTVRTLLLNNGLRHEELVNAVAAWPFTLELLLLELAASRRS